MPRKEFNDSGYQIMWIFAMFDLPTTNASERRTAAQFRKLLLNEGFIMLQYSVYTRPCSSDASAEVHRKTIRNALPEDGKVRMFTITDRQFEKMENYIGQTDVPPEDHGMKHFLF